MKVIAGQPISRLLEDFEDPDLTNLDEFIAAVRGLIGSVAIDAGVQRVERGRCPVRSAAISVRISHDPAKPGVDEAKGREADALGVRRQVIKSFQLAEQRGWPVGDVYVDNDLSAFSGRPRPDYRRMLADIECGSRDAVITYNMDRLYRIPSELEEFIAVCDRTGLRAVATATADVDMGSDDGLFMARILVAVAAKESARKSKRIIESNTQKARLGKAHVTARRPFGYERDCVTVREDEAEVIRDLARRAIAGEAMTSLTAWLQDHDVPTVTGKPWRSYTVRGMLTSGRIAGLREYGHEVIGKAEWEPIITVAERDKILARFAVKADTGRRTPRTYVLSGLLRCGQPGCGARLHSSVRYKNTSQARRYVCQNGPDHGGCGRLTVVAEPVENLIVGAVLVRLDSPALEQAWSRRAGADANTSALKRQMDTDVGMLDELAAAFSGKAITMREWIAARDPIHARIADARRRLAHATETTALAELIGTGAELRGQWPDLGIDRRQAVIKAAMDHAVIAPGTKGARVLDPARVKPVWN